MGRSGDVAGGVSLCDSDGDVTACWCVQAEGVPTILSACGRHPPFSPVPCSHYRGWLILCPSLTALLSISVMVL